MFPCYLLPFLVGLSSATSTNHEEYAPASSSAFKGQSSPGNLYYYVLPLQKKAHHDSMYTGSSAPHSYAAPPPIGPSYSMRPGSPYDPSASYGIPPAGAYGLSGLGGYGYNGVPSYGVQPSYGNYPSPVGSYPSYPAPAATSFLPQLSPYTSYQQQQPSYGPNGQNRRYGLSSLIMPMLALAGLGLLIPSVGGNLSSGRKKRDASDLDTVRKELLEKYTSLYRSAMENEECMNRVVCELGRSLKNVQGKTPVLSVMEKIMPSWMKPKMSIFKSAALSAEVGKCEKYKC